MTDVKPDTPDEKSQPFWLRILKVRNVLLLIWCGMVLFGPLVLFPLSNIENPADRSPV